MHPGFEQQGPAPVRAFGVAPVQVVAIAYAAWLVGLSIIFHLLPDNKVLQELALLAGAIPAMMQCVFCRWTPAATLRGCGSSGRSC